MVWLRGLMQTLEVDLARGLEDEKKAGSLTVFSCLVEDLRQHR